MAALLAEQGAAASMSRRGNCNDNARMESFRAALEAECFAGARPPTRQAAKRQIFDRVEGFHHRSSLHSGLGYQSPLACETNLQVQQKLTANQTTGVQSAFSRKDQTPNPGFDNRSPEELIEAGERDPIWEMIHQTRHGAFA